MKFDRQLRPATGTSWVVSYGGKTIPRWRTAAILKIDISPYLSERSSDFHDVIKKWKSCIGETPSSTERISCSKTTTLLPSAKCTHPLFQGRTGCGGRPSSWHDIVTCQRLVIYSSKAGVKEKLSMSASAVTSAVQRTQMKRRSLPTDTLTSRRQT